MPFGVDLTRISAWFKKSRFWVTLHGKFDHHYNDDLKYELTLEIKLSGSAENPAAPANEDDFLQSSTPWDFYSLAQKRHYA